MSGSGECAAFLPASPQLFDKILKEIIKRGNGIEVNTSGINRAGFQEVTLFKNREPDFVSIL